MREIKFRVFDPNTDEMIVTGVGIGDISYYDFDGDNITEQEGLIIMQYTGLKDKNGVEIYEGDLLKKRNYKDAIYKVVWTKHGFELRHDFIRKYKGDSWQETAYLPIHERDYEVIGNIYEHPHLLEVGE